MLSLASYKCGQEKRLKRFGRRLIVDWSFYLLRLDKTRDKQFDCFEWDSLLLQSTSNFLI